MFFFHSFTFVLLLLSPFPRGGSDVSMATMEGITKCTSQHMMEAVKQSSQCKPMPKVVKLKIPGNGSYTQMTPQFVEAKRCGGGCYKHSHSCVSISSTTRQIPVMLSSCGMSVGLCSKSCAVLDIQEDTACHCDCLQKQKVCHNIKQTFNSEECMCECTNKEEFILCRDQGRLWDNEKCMCRCGKENMKPCSTGLVFNPATCSCVAEMLNNISDPVTDNRIERSDRFFTNERNFAEVLIIVTLAGLTTVFFIIIISLLHNIRTLRRSIKNINYKGGKDVSNENLGEYNEELLETYR